MVSGIEIQYNLLGQSVQVNVEEKNNAGRKSISRSCVSFCDRCWYEYARHMNKKNYMPVFLENQWNELKSIRKASTGKEYAKKLAAFLNWLDSKNVIYENAIDHHVREFLHECGFGSLWDEKVLSLQSTVGYLL